MDVPPPQQQPRDNENSRAYQYFARTVKATIRDLRPGWKQQQVENTMLYLYHEYDHEKWKNALRDHTGVCDFTGEGRARDEMIPEKPKNKGDVTKAKGKKGLFWPDFQMVEDEEQQPGELVVHDVQPIHEHEDNDPRADIELTPEEEPQGGGLTDPGAEAEPARYPPGLNPVAQFGFVAPQRDHDIIPLLPEHYARRNENVRRLNEADQANADEIIKNKKFSKAQAQEFRRLKARIEELEKDRRTDINEIENLQNNLGRRENVDLYNVKDIRSYKANDDKGDEMTMYPFWPDLPWHDEPEIDNAMPKFWDTDDQGDDTKEQKQNTAKNKKLWLKSEPKMWNAAEGQRWEGRQFLGQGSYGRAGIWVQLDENSNIQDRMVIKECIPRSAHWIDPTFWRNKRPREIWMHQLVERYRNDEDGGHRNLIKFRGYRLMMRAQQYRIYLDFYPGGDLYEAISKHLNHDWWGKRKGEPPEHLPEPFLWYVLKALVDACRVLQKGKLSVSKKVEGWRSIQHLDISLSNIFLDEDDRKKDGGNDGENVKYEWPTPVLSDFGLSFYPLVAGSNGDNPRTYLISAQDARYPPETQGEQAKVDNPYPLDEKADVWMIGAVMWYLITLQAPTKDMLGPMWDPPLPHQQVSNVRVDLHSAPPDKFSGSVLERGLPWLGAYTEELRRLVTECLSYYPDYRPTLEDISTQISRRPKQPKSQPVVKLKRPKNFGHYSIHPDHRSKRRCSK